jgi:hypothetical protein
VQRLGELAHDGVGHEHLEERNLPDRGHGNAFSCGEAAATFGAAMVELGKKAAAGLERVSSGSNRNAL